MENIVYNKASMEDINILVNLRIEFLEEYWGTQTEEQRDELAQSLRNYFSKTIDGSYICYIATHDHQPIGIGAMVIREQPGGFKNLSGKVGYIMNMYTLPSFRRQGISTNILNLLLEDGRQKGINMFELHATKEGEPVYIKNGFKLHPEPTYRKSYA